MQQSLDFPKANARIPDATLDLLEMQLIEAERVEAVARETMSALATASIEQHQRAYGVYLAAEERRRALLRLIDEAAHRRSR